MRPLLRLLGRRAFLSFEQFGKATRVIRGALPSSQRRYNHKMADDPKYASWTKTSLIERIKKLEGELYTRPSPSEAPSAQVAESTPASDSTTPAVVSTPKNTKKKRNIDPSQYQTRFIALRLAYLGKNYGGYEFQAAGNVETIEEHLWKALTKAHLIFPQDANVVDWSCCDYSKCGRTDRGVSAFGQVIGLRVKSNRPASRKRSKLENEELPDSNQTANGRPDNGDDETTSEPTWDHIRDELPYARMLNRVLPADIRILAWCPSPPPDFSARFSCRERQYRYFFTQPAFSPESLPDATPSSDSPPPVGWLDVGAMEDAASRFVGEHDFRNFCKVDPAKMMTNFKRTMFEVSITEVENAATALPYIHGLQPSSTSLSPDEVVPKVYSFNVKGSAFLWHQIRHMIGVLFLVGQGLELPSIVTEMLDVDTNPRKPNFSMADEVPLVLWDCIFPKNGDRTQDSEALDWVLAEENATVKFGGIVDAVWGNWREKKMDELLASQLLNEIATQQQRKEGSSLPAPDQKSQKPGKPSLRVYEGGKGARPNGKYVPLLKRAMLEEPEVQLEKFAKKKGYLGADDMRKQKGYRSAMNVDE